jgi:hypothetical protein
VLKPEGRATRVVCGLRQRTSERFLNHNRARRRRATPWAVKPFSCRPVYFIRDYPYKINMGV